MKDFNLKEALAGAKVITVGGVEVTQLTMMNIAGVENLVAVYKEEVLRWNIRGVSVKDRSHVSLDLKMAQVMGEGFLHVYDDGYFILDDKKCTNLGDPIMIFDLSEYPIGFGV